MDKFCRICWNTSNWKQPTGEAAKLEIDSYVAQYGFGHEEWLFNFSWLLKRDHSADTVKYKYGFLQPIGKYYNKYMGKTFSVLLYTRSPEGKCLLVAQIEALYVPDEKELSYVLSQMYKSGWITVMQSELSKLGMDATPIRNPHPRDIVNVRFSPDNVEFFDPRPMVDNNHTICLSPRYHPFDWDGAFPSSGFSQSNDTSASNKKDDDPTRSEEARIKASIESTVYNPQHVRLQNTLYKWLCSLHGEENVDYEKDFVDLIVRDNEKTIFIEIKTSLTTKRCIREAMGQLIEYSHYPNHSKAEELLIVGDAIPTLKDKLYLDFLRTNYNLVIKYSRWNWALSKLEVPI